MGQSRPVNRLALIVEDDVQQRQMLSDLLEDENMKVISCESAEAGVAVMNEFGGDLAVLITDVNLAGTMTGLELAVVARRGFPSLRIVVVSGYDQDVPEDICFLRKPWRPLDMIHYAVD